LEFCRISPIAWSHLVFTGRYSFVKSDGKIDIALLVEKLEELWRGRFNYNLDEIANKIPEAA